MSTLCPRQRKEANLQKFGRSESSHPHEASFGRSLPHSRDEMEDVGLGSNALKPENLIIMSHSPIHQHAQLVVCYMSLQCSPEVAHLAMLLLHPSPIFQVKSSSTWEYIDILTGVNSTTDTSDYSLVEVLLSGLSNQNAPQRKDSVLRLRFAGMTTKASIPGLTAPLSPLPTTPCGFWSP